MSEDYINPFRLWVGSFLPNPAGLYDMQGNVSQWVADCIHDDYEGAPADGSAGLGGACDERVLRGGSWADTAGYFRDAMRLSASPDPNAPDFGFRVARTLER